MDVYEAVDSRRAVRAFSDEPVPRDVLRRVLTAATRAPSSGNLQPWRVYVVTGGPLAELKRRATARALAGDPGDEREYPMYPDGLPSPYVDRFAAAAAQRYAALGIERDDPDRPRRIATLNSGAFGAPAVLFCYLDRSMGPGQWADAGMYLQTVMLLLRAEGVHSCPQVCGRRTAPPSARSSGPTTGRCCSAASRWGTRRTACPRCGPGARTSARP
ncbi:nitroreductase [Isoptericola sp. NPDC056578]|uniref:nitroreductase n=1 Tax=Isoptericola sp. NPDC056578 TaxID=3345870 RepID=UPI0036C94638